MQNYFKHCTSLDDVKKLYRTLAKELHPDKGGDPELMKILNNQYEKAVKQTVFASAATAEECETEILNAEAYREAIEKISNLDGITIELVGSWLWVTGDTRKHKDILKAHPQPFTWAKKKTDLSAWFFRTAEYKAANKGTKKDLDTLRAKYGSQTVNPTNRRTAYAIQ